MCSCDNREWGLLGIRGIKVYQEGPPDEESIDGTISHSSYSRKALVGYSYKSDHLVSRNTCPPSAFETDNLEKADFEWNKRKMGLNPNISWTYIMNIHHEH